MEYPYTNHMYRQNIHVGDLVAIVLKEDQGTERRVHGTVKQILTNKPFHSRGIKVMLADGQVGRVQQTFSKLDKNYAKRE